MGRDRGDARSRQGSRRLESTPLRQVSDWAMYLRTVSSVNDITPRWISTRVKVFHGHDFDGEFAPSPRRA